MHAARAVSLRSYCRSDSLPPTVYLLLPALISPACGCHRLASLASHTQQINSQIMHTNSDHDPSSNPCTP